MSRIFRLFGLIVLAASVAGTFVVTLTGWPPAAAWAAPPLNSCTAAPWIKRVVQLYDGLTGFKCDVLKTEAASGVNLRVVQDANRKLPDADVFRDLILSSAKAAFAKYREIRPALAYNNVTFVLTPDDLPGKVLAAADAGLNGECIVVVGTGGVSAKDPAKRAVTLPLTIAHELVHCVQRWNFAGQMAVPKGDRLWWAEGSADYLANTVFESEDDIARITNDFADHARNTPLTQQSYETYVYFSWLAQNKGPAAVFAFMGAMPTVAGEPAQRAALLAQTNAEQLQAFARDYVEGKIMRPQNKPIPGPVLGSPSVFSDSDVRTVNQDGLTLFYGHYAFEGGVYNLAITQTAKPEIRFKVGDKPWGPPPAQIGSSCDGGEVMRYVGFPVASGAKVKLEVKAAKTKDKGLQGDACQSANLSFTGPGSQEEPPEPVGPIASCMPYTAHDDCLVGDWVLDEDATLKMVEDHLRASGELNPDEELGGGGAGLLRLLANGVGSMTFDDFDIGGLFRKLDPDALIIVNVNGTMGANWASNGNSLRMCPISNSVRIRTDTKLFTPMGVIPAKTDTPGAAEPHEYSYTCSATKLVLTVKGSTGGLGSTWTYNRKH